MYGCHLTSKLQSFCNCNHLLKYAVPFLYSNNTGYKTAKLTMSSIAGQGDKFALAKRFHGLEGNVWVEFGQLALDYKPLNLGQGFPDYPIPEYIPKTLAAVASDSNVLLHQYTRSFGHPRLVNVLSKFYGQLIGRNIDPLKEVLVTYGAYEALYCAISGNINPGDEAIIIEPYYDCYEPMVRMCGGKPVFVALNEQRKPTGTATSADWTLDYDELKAAFSSKTKMIIVNTPHNPLGKVYSVEELEMIGKLCQEFDTLCIMDEVYEWITYGEKKHVRMNTLPGMWERTVTIGSAGKTFSATGWKLGWAYAPANLMTNLQIPHQHCVYTSSTPIQEAVARAFEFEMSRLDSPECYFNSLSVELIAKRDYMAKFLSEVGMTPIVPEGSYFMLADWTSLASKADLDSETDPERDYRFAKWLSKVRKLQGIPTSAFYSPYHKTHGENYIRFCFFKNDTVLQQAEKILQEWKQSF